MPSENEKSKADQLPAPRASNGENQAGPSESKRSRIVRVAGELFLVKGYDSVTINDIIEVAGGSKATIYAKFGDKENLFDAVVEQMCSNVTVQINVTFTGTLEEQLKTMGHSFATGVLTTQILQLHRLMTSIGRTFPKAGRLFYDTGPRVTYGIFQSWIERHQKTGAIRNDEDPRRLAILFHDMLIGDSMLDWLTSASEEEERLKRIDKTVSLAVQIFLAGCATKPE